MAVRPLRTGIRRTLAIVLLFPLAACGRSEDAAAPAGPGPDVRGSPRGAVTDDAYSELLEFSRRWAPAPLKAAYRFRTTTATGTVVLYRRSKDSWRVDLETGGSVSIVIRVRDTSYVCTGSAEEGTCLRSETPERIPTPVPAPFLKFLVRPGALREDIRRGTATSRLERTNATIAGQRVNCFRAADAQRSGSDEWCLTDDAILLRLVAGRPTTAERFHLEATSVERNIHDEDLQPPYPAAEVRP